MSTERTERDLINARFWFRETYGYERDPPKPEYAIFFFKTILHIAGADGIISEPERQWVVGLASVSGFPQNVIDELKVYEPGDSDIVTKFFHDSNEEYIKASRCSILYHGLRAAIADGELHEKEREAVFQLAKKLNVSDEEVEKIYAFIVEESKLAEKRAKIVFPDGLDFVLDVYDKTFLQKNDQS